MIESETGLDKWNGHSVLDARLNSLRVICQLFIEITLNGNLSQYDADLLMFNDLLPIAVQIVSHTR